MVAEAVRASRHVHEAFPSPDASHNASSSHQLDDPFSPGRIPAPWLNQEIHRHQQDDLE